MLMVIQDTSGNRYFFIHGDSARGFINKHSADYDFIYDSLQGKKTINQITLLMVEKED